ncbi:chain length determinant protein EpsF [Nitrogeniibacter aestuarii]|uniref:chain length determinant protein EpsF n=1 Tax=Nitrogeniibacter aestuarii TaxID=2815343 RepID=UPI001E54CDB0|nr:chain length determinant protein EpsF [Nitrogeniibacter aestuarii]
MSIQQLLLILRARIWVVLITFSIVVGAAVVLSLVLPKKYTATTSVVVEAKTNDPLMGGLLPAQMIPGYMATQTDIIESDRVAQRVVSMLNLTKVQSIQDDWRSETDGVGSITVWLARLLKESLDVEPSLESNVVQISYSGADPQFSAALANAWAQAYIDTSLELKVEPAKQYAKWFDIQTDELRKNLTEAQKRLSDYQQEQGIVATDERLDVESARLAELSTQLSMIKAQRVDSESRQAQSRNAESMPEVMSNGVIQGLKVDLARQESMRDQLAARYGVNYPEIARVDADIASLKQKISSEIQRVVRSLGTTTRVDVQRESEIQAALDAQKKRVLALKAERDKISVLLRDVENAQHAYDLVTQRLAQTNLESQTQHTNIVVLTPASPPLEPSSPKIVLNTVLASFLGLLLGVGFGFFWEILDPRVRGRNDLSQVAGLPVLGIVPPAVKSLAGA